MNLAYFRSQIDAIDEKIISLLKERVEVVKQVGEFKKATSASQSFIRAGREAGMLRQLTKKAEGVFPPQAIATIWRMVISSSLGIEQDIAIYTYLGNDKTCFWLAREYFGTFLDMHQMENADRLIDIIANIPTAVGVLPLIDNSQNPWWVRPQKETNNIYVFARIPFIADENVTPVLAIANTSPEPTGNDISLLAITTSCGEEKLQSILKQHGLNFTILCKNGNNNYLIETSGFIEIGDKLIKEVENFLGSESLVRLLGAYAVPIVI